MRTLIIDNYDSFTYNIFQMIAAINGSEPIVVRNDAVPWSRLRALDYDNVVISPGPGSPDKPADFGVCAELLREEERPILGVCLGHQGICHVLGGVVQRAPVPMHGRLSDIHHTGTGLFQELPSPFKAVRYHSLIASAPLPPGLRPVAWTGDELIMAVEHADRPLWGVQFHPESILSEHGERLFGNFRTLTARRSGGRPARPRAEAGTASAGPAVPAEPGRDGGAPAVHFRLLAKRAPRYVEPEAAFTALFAASAHAFWLDGAARPEKGFSYMGDDDGPNGAVLVHSRARAATVERRHGNHAVLEGDILSVLQRRIADAAIDAPDLPFPFKGGYLGYLGYELSTPDGWQARHVSEHPDAQFIFPGRFLCFDHAEKAVYAAVVVPANDPSDAGWIDSCLARLDRLPSPPAPPPRDDGPALPVAAEWLHPKEEYARLIEECLDEIRAGESYEICLTNRIHLPPLADPLNAYRTLRRINPAPHAAFLRFDDLTVLCSSPERFLEIGRDGTVTTKPIKGTRRRGATPEEDALLRADLAGSEKDRSENLMITDLLRNDLGAVCRVGSVRVPRLMAVESYPTVHQLVTTVEGQLRPDRDAVDCIRATFPGGSMTGAPKRRTMEIIDRLEGSARGVYSGSIGFLSLDGAADLNIVIRTIVADRRRSVIGTGGAIVALSDPASEIKEIELKAAALLKAVSSGTAAAAEPATPSRRFGGAP